MTSVFLRGVFAGALIVAPALARAEEKAVLVVTVQHISPKGGVLRLGLFDAKSYADDASDSVVAKVVPAKLWNVVVTFDPVPPGTYAVKMYQDANNNEKFDFNWLGLPAERYGFSNNAGVDWLRLSAPGFDAAKIVLKPGTNSISIWLH